MKKITFLITLFFIAQSNAQVLLSESFDTALNWTVTHTVGISTNPGWTQVSAGTLPNIAPNSAPGMAKFNCYDIPANNSYSLTSPAIEFTGASYRVRFSMYKDGGYPDDNDRVRVYYNTMPTSAGGTLLGTVSRSIALAPVVSAEGWYSFAFNITGNPSGTGYISLVATSAFGNNIYVDDISVNQIQSDDAEISSVSVPVITASQSNTISGTFKNMGSNAITSVDVNWQVDGGTIYTQTLSGLDVAPAAIGNYTSTDVWNTPPGSYSLKVWLSNPNGVADSDLTNNEITKMIFIASNSTARLPLYEKFSSSTCPPCAQFNGTYFTPFYTANHDDFAFISYQVNWPGAGDPYYTLETGSRVGYYGVNAAPTLFVDAKEGTNFNVGQLTSALAAAEAKPAFFAVNAQHGLSGNDITVNVNVTPYLDGNYTLHAVVVEKLTYDNAATNGETQFKNVMMKMLPNASGTPMTFTHDVPQSVTLQANLNGLNIEEFTDLDVVVFIQNNADKSIMNSGYSANTLGTNQFKSSSAFKIYPNPSTGIVRVKTQTPVDVTVTDMTGKVVYTASQITSENQINLSAYQSGIYFAKISNADTQETQKIILK